MKAIRIAEPGKIEIVDVETPVARDGEALLRVLYGGICGADVASYTGNQPFTTYPRIPGHEFSAQIVTIPENNRGLKSGDIVTCNPYFNCGSCYACRKGLVNACMDNQTMGVQRDGAYQEYITMPVERIIPGKGLGALELALIEPFAISHHALSRCEVRPGDKLMITGAGPIGLFALLAAKVKGAEVTVTDMLDGRLEKAKAFGADHTVNIGAADVKEQLQAASGGRGFDVCVEASGQPAAFLGCIEHAAQGANLVLIGNGKTQTTFLHSLLIKKELNIFGSRNAYTADFEALIDLVSSGKTDVLQMISAVCVAADADKAFEVLAHNDGSLEKVLIRFAGPK